MTTLLVSPDYASHDYGLSALGAELARWLPRRRPTVFVSLGTFLSARDDVLATIAAALRRLDVDVVLATGVARLGPLPHMWHVRPVVPQVAALAACDAVICHGGNNTLTEALTAGLPVLAGPFSSDQFVAAEDLRRGGVGDAFEPNRARPAELADRLTALLEGRARPRAAALGARLRQRPGAERAWELIDQSGSARTMSISTSAPSGSDATPIVLRAGGSLGK